MVRVGLIGENHGMVSDETTALYMGSGALEVYATPALIALMEGAAVEAIDHELQDGYTSVGIEVHIQHISATPVGEKVIAMAEITHVEDRRVTLEVRAWDERELIGKGIHVRYIINIENFMARLDDSNNV